jgi:serine/threonine protein kinase HipA of HipAB toxin-antitoxin module
MSKDTPGGGTPAQGADALTADIERTRQELGETVEALVAKTDVKARAQHRAAEVAGDLRGRARTAIGRARAGARGAKEKAKEKVAEHGPAAQAMRSVRVYSVAAAAGTALLLAWLTARRRRR